MKDVQMCLEEFAFFLSKMRKVHFDLSSSQYY